MHVDPIGTILFPLIAMVSNVPLIGWAKPVPVAVQNLRGNWRQKYMLIAAAGPASNLLLAVLFAIALRVSSGGSPFEVVAGPVDRVLFNAVTLNVLLAVFNMIPVPPLDGGRVMAGLLPPALAIRYNQLGRYGFIIIYGLLLSGILWAFVDPIAASIRSVLL